MFVGGYFIDASIKYTLLAAFDTMAGVMRWGLRNA